MTAKYEFKPGVGWLDTGTFGEAESRLLRFAAEIRSEGDLPIDWLLGHHGVLVELALRCGLTEATLENIDAIIFNALTMHDELTLGQ